MDQEAMSSEAVGEVRFSIPEDEVRTRIGVSRAAMNRLRGPEFQWWAKGLNGRILWSEAGLEAAATQIAGETISQSPEASADPDVAQENGAPEGVAPISVSATPEPQVHAGGTELAPGEISAEKAPATEPAAFVVSRLPDGVFAAVVVRAQGYANDALVLARREDGEPQADSLRVMVGKGRRNLFRPGMRLLCRPRFGTAGIYDFEGNPDLPEKGRRWPRRPGTW